MYKILYEWGCKTKCGGFPSRNDPKTLSRPPIFEFRELLERYLPFVETMVSR